MVIVQKLTAILASMAGSPSSALQSWQYNDLATANIRLDRDKPNPTAVMYQITDWYLDISTGLLKERAAVNVSFLQKEGKLDAGGLGQDQIIDAMKDIAVDFISAVKSDDSLAVLDDSVKMRSVFLRSDSNRTGVNVQMEIEERQGSCI